MRQSGSLQKTPVHNDQSIRWILLFGFIDLPDPSNYCITFNSAQKDSPEYFYFFSFPTVSGNIQVLF